MSQTYRARAKAKVIITLVTTLCSTCGTGLMGARHINPLFIHEQDRCVDGYGCISLLLTLIPEADGLEFSMWHRLLGPFSLMVLKRVVVSICSVSSFSCSATIVALSKLFELQADN